MPGLVRDELLGGLDHLERERFLTEPQVLGGDETIQEDVYTYSGQPLRYALRYMISRLTFTDGVRHSDYAVHRWLSVQTTDEVREIVEDRQVVLNSNNVVIRGEETADNLGSDQALPNIQIGRGLIKHVAA